MINTFSMPASLHLMDSLKGSLVALVTPFLEDTRIDEKALIALIQMHIDSGTSGIVVGGTTGEGVALSEEDLFRIIRLAVEVARGRLLIIANTGTANTLQTIERTRRAASMGVDACMLITPYYVKPSQMGLLAHFSAVHAATDVPLIIYNVPSRTAVDLQPETVNEIAQMERYVAIKDATADLSRLKNCLLPSLSGDDATVLDHFLHGGVGAISVTANVVPELMNGFYRHCFEGQFEAARKLHQRLLPIHQALFCATNPVPVKYALSLQGLCTPTVRLPLVELDTREKEFVEAALESVLQYAV